MTNLLPCPFCGGEAEYGLTMAGEEVYCTECKAAMPRITTEDATLEAWTKRAEQPTVAVANVSFTKEQLEKLKQEIIHDLTTYRMGERTCHDVTEPLPNGMPFPDTFTCSECGYRWDGVVCPNYCGNCGAKVVEHD